MSNRQGFWVFHRKMWDNPYMNRPAYLSVWCWLLSESQWQEGKRVIFCGKPVALKAGQLTCGRKQISKTTGVPSGTVYRILKTFENEHQIEQRTDKQKSMITILKWKDYQEREQESEQRMSNERATNEQRMNTTEQLNNKTRITVENPEAVRLANLLAEWVAKNTDGRARKPNIEKWASDIEKMLRIDGHSVEEVEYVLNWCQQDKFWCTNILSAAKLREKYSMLYVRIKAEQSKK